MIEIKNYLGLEKAFKLKTLLPDVIDESKNPLPKELRSASLP